MKVCLLLTWSCSGLGFVILPKQQHQPLRSTATSDDIWPVANPDELDGYNEEREDFHIPKGGVSVSDEIEEASQDKFITQVVPINGLDKVAQIVTTTAKTASFEPVRYLTPLSPPLKTSKGSFKPARYALIDIPPYSPQLAIKLNSFMGNHSQLAMALITNRDAIHHDHAPAVYTSRRSDLIYWQTAFPEMKIVAYRLDIPRDCRESVTQVLDGYGPFGLKDEPNANFTELGRPLTVEAWDPTVAEDILRGAQSADDYLDNGDSEAEYSPEKVRAREDESDVLAIYTPGHSFGSLSYIFPKEGLCFSGFTIPVEDTRSEANLGLGGAGPALDCRGYITTSRAGLQRQMDSASELVEGYVDRFKVLLPSRGDPLFLSPQLDERKEDLLEVLGQYRLIGEIYEKLGITSDPSDYDDD